LKNHTEPEHGRADLEQPDAAELKRRAAEDAVSDADSYALDTRPRCKMPSGAEGLDPASSLLTNPYARGRVGSQEGIDGLLIHPSEGGTRLVLSDEILEISHADEVAALMAEPIKIFHVQAPVPWVEEIRAGTS